MSSPRLNIIASPKRPKSLDKFKQFDNSRMKKSVTIRDSLIGRHSLLLNVKELEEPFNIDPTTLFNLDNGFNRTFHQQNMRKKRSHSEFYSRLCLLTEKCNAYRDLFLKKMPRHIGVRRNKSDDKMKTNKKAKF